MAMSILRELRYEHRRECLLQQLKNFLACMENVGTTWNVTQSSTDFDSDRDTVSALQVTARVVSFNSGDKEIRHTLNPVTDEVRCIIGRRKDKADRGNLGTAVVHRRSKRHPLRWLRIEMDRILTSAVPTKFIRSKCTLAP